MVHTAPTTLQSALEFLQLRFPESAIRISEMVALGEVYDSSGAAISDRTPFIENQDLYLFRDPPHNEPQVAALYEIEILHRDENLLVIDKPHLVSVMPRGRWVTQTALVYLRNLLDLPELAPVHRLDRPTAGVLIFTVRPEVRGAYQMLFQNREVQKEYLAVTEAPVSGSKLVQRQTYPLTVRSRIVKHRGVAPAQEVPGEPNAETEVHLSGVNSITERALWRLKPKTGKTHQLRLHLNSLGVPIIGDPFWPVVKPDLEASEGPPLQLLAKVIEFIDPLSGDHRRFESQRRLSCWE